MASIGELVFIIYRQCSVCNFARMGVFWFARSKKNIW
jgi:hypothetical protein